MNNLLLKVGDIFIKFMLNNWAVLGCCLLLGGFLGSALRFEYFWDFANYHYYNPFAFFNNRLNYDIVPASVNTFFNPLIDLPTYFLIEFFNDNPAVYYAIKGLSWGVLLFLFYKILLLYFDVNKVLDCFYVLLAMIIGATGHATFFQLGTSTNEIDIACFVLTSFYFLIKMLKYTDLQRKWKFFACGCLLGIGLGLKQTIIIYCVGLGLSFIVCHKYFRRPILFVFLFALGGVVGFLISNGYFMWRYWAEYGNPFMPFFNGIFHSPYFDDFNFSDRRFVPGIARFIYYPFLWYRWEFFGFYDIETPHRICEKSYMDIRLTVFYIIIWGIVLYGVVKNKYADWKRNYPLDVFLFVFLFVVFFLWLFVFSIVRYAVSLEILSAIIVVRVLIFLFPKNNLLKQVVYSVLGIWLIFFFVGNVCVNGMDQNKSPKVLDIEEVNLPNNTLVKLYNFPTAFVIPWLSRMTNARALGYLHLNPYYMKGSDFVERGKFREMRDKVEKEHHGIDVLIYNVVFPELSPGDRILRETKQYRKGKYCRKLGNNINENLYICVPKKLKCDILPEKCMDEGDDYE